MRVQHRFKEDDDDEEEDEIEQLFPSGDELPIASPNEYIQMWFTDNSGIGVTAIPDEEVSI